jgi:hypothetical protein
MFPPGHDALCERIMEQIYNSDNVDVSKRILACMTIIYRPIILKELTSSIDILEGYSKESESLEEVIKLYNSFLTLRDNTIHFMH